MFTVIIRFVEKQVKSRLVLEVTNCQNKDEAKSKALAWFTSTNTDLTKSILSIY